VDAVTSPQARKGRRAELAVANYLAANGWPYAEPTRRSGWADDRGDIDGLGPVVVEVKDHKQFAIPAWLHELELEVVNANAVTGVLVVKRRGHSDPGDWYAITTLRDWSHLAKDAGL
jgi:hypothetical protein